MKQREFIISIDRLKKFDKYTWMHTQHELSENELNGLKKSYEFMGFDFDLEKEKIRKMPCMAIIDGQFYDVLFAQDWNGCHVYFVKELKGHYTYHNVFGGKRHGMKTTGYAVYYHKDFDKASGNAYYKELSGKAFYSERTNQMYVKVDF